MGVVNAAAGRVCVGLYGMLSVFQERKPLVAGLRRVIVGANGSPGSLPALRYGADVAAREKAALVAVHAWVPRGSRAGVG